MIYVQLQISCILPLKGKWQETHRIFCKVSLNSFLIHNLLDLQHQKYLYVAIASMVISKSPTRLVQNLCLNTIEIYKISWSIPLKGGCTRFEVKHISCNLLLYIGKPYFSENFRAFQVTCQNSNVPIWAENSELGSYVRILEKLLNDKRNYCILHTIVSYMTYVQLQILCTLPLWDEIWCCDLCNK